MTRMRSAACPTMGGAPGAGKWTTDGVNRCPSASAITSGMPESTVATSELVVPRSMPTILLMVQFVRASKIAGKLAYANWFLKSPASIYQKCRRILREVIRQHRKNLALVARHIRADAHERVATDRLVENDFASAAVACRHLRGQFHAIIAN